MERIKTLIKLAKTKGIWVFEKINNPLVWLIISVVILFFAVFIYYRSNINYQKIINSGAYSQEKTKRENEKILKDVGRIINLPQNENPTIATIQNIETLKNGPSAELFIKGENGDKVIMYSKEKKLILYRPNEKRIIDVVALTILEGTFSELEAKSD